MSGQHRPIAKQVEVAVRLNLSLSAAQRRAAEEARLQLVHAGSGWQTGAQQLDGDVWASVPLSMLRERWALQMPTRPASDLIIARRDRATRQLLIEEEEKPVLQYNYWTVDRPERHAQVSPENRIYSRPRSNYIHPLYGLAGVGGCVWRLWGAKEAGGLLIFPHAENPHHPPDWVEYPDLNWIQPTFPAAGVRYELKPGKPLTLRDRLWVWNGEEPPQDVWQAHWNAYHLAVTGGET